jgi:hypothetical protein
MIRQEIYEKVSDRFGVSIGVANIMSVAPITDVKGEVDKKMYLSLRRELKINAIIGRAIDGLKYKELQREVYRLGTQYSGKKIGELTIYNRAWGNVINKPNSVRNGNNKTKSESGEVLKAEQ